MCSARIVNIWNSLPNSVVDACTVNAFKARLDKFWKHQAVKFDFTADLTGTKQKHPSNCSVCCHSFSAFCVYHSVLCTDLLSRFMQIK